MAKMMKRAWPLFGLLAPLLAAGVAWSAVEAPPAMPPIHGPLTPPVGADRKPRATVMFAHYRYDHILWENARPAHRLSGQALEAAEPPSSSGIDAWGKNVRWPF